MVGGGDTENDSLTPAAAIGAAGAQGPIDLRIGVTVV